MGGAGMKYLGQYSLSSLLKSLLDITWWGMIISVIIMSFLLPLLFFIPGLFGSEPTTISYPLGSSGVRFSQVDLDPFTFLFLLFCLLMTTACLMYIVFQLRRIFTSLIEKKPFVSGNAARIQRIGLAVILMSLVKVAPLQFLFYFTPLINVNQVIRKSWPSFNFFEIFLGLIIIVLAEVFRYGERLQSDQDMTI